MSDRPRKSWPLFVLAGLGFIPFLGLVFGSIALAWGLTSSRPRAMRAGIIGGSGALLNVAAFVLLGLFDDDDTKKDAVRHDLESIAEALEEYRRKEGEYPPTLAILQRKMLFRRMVSIQDLAAPGIPGFRSYQYVRNADGRSYDLYSAGPDGEPGTVDDIRAHFLDWPEDPPGYRPPLGIRPGALDSLERPPGYQPPR